MKLISLLLCISLTGISPQNQEKKSLQYAIEQAFTTCITTKSDQPLEEMVTALTSAFEQEDTISTRYWLSYAYYYQALFAGEINKNEKRAEPLIDTATSLLKPSNTDSESLALLSLQTGYSIRFKSYFSMMNLGQDSKEYAKKALEINANNLRAYYALALNNFYTPKVFGGGSEVEFYLKKALSLTETTKTENQPSWGKESVYELLIKHYQKEEKGNLATKYLTEGLELFPDSKLLKGLKKPL